MARKLSSEQSFKLARAFHQLSTILGNYRFEHWEDMTRTQRQKMEGLQWTLLNASSDFNARAVVMKTHLLKEEISTLNDTILAMGTTLEKIENTRHAIRIATKAVAFGGGIASGNVPVSVAAGLELLNEINRPTTA